MILLESQTKGTNFYSISGVDMRNSENNTRDDYVCFWENLEFLRSVYLLSAGDLCKELNKALEALGAPDSEMYTENKFRYGVRSKPKVQSGYLYNAIGTVFSPLWFDRESSKEEFFTVKITNGNVHEILGFITPATIDPSTSWAKNLWDNMSYLYSFDSRLEKETFGDMSRNAFFSLRSQKKLLPSGALREMAKRVGLRTYPMLYVCPFDEKTRHLVYNYYSMMTSIDVLSTPLSQSAIPDFDDVASFVEYYQIEEEKMSQALAGMNRIHEMLKHLTEQSRSKEYSKDDKRE